MPLWRIYHPSTILADEESQTAFAKAVTTKIYPMLPNFYPVLIFIPTQTLYVRGVKNANYVRIEIQEIARTRNGSARVATLKHIDDILRPFILDRKAEDGGADGRRVEVVGKGGGEEEEEEEEEDVKTRDEKKDDDERFHVEWHIVETSLDLWSIDGFRPPPMRSFAEQTWKVTGEPVAFGREDEAFCFESV